MIGRTAEAAFFGRVLRDLAAASILEVVGLFIPTKKNGATRDFYKQLGFAQAGVRTDGSEEWRFRLADGLLELPPHIRMTERTVESD